MASKANKAKPPSAGKEEAVGGAKGLLRAGLKALGDVRDDVVLRQSRVFEALLGIDASHAVINGVEKLRPESREALGLHKFEAVFDQRVARSLERLGVPSPEALANLVRQLEAINQHLQRIEAPAAATTAPAKKKRAPRRSTPKA
ncbi:phasin family protein [Aquincola sp. S2]|uniref:Phasin family protein n=1 Tax=Pseudaquabacterium terrae TaxID=2732868 RepID=A0ABX2EGD6_9BURK|nr:phasin family protein [Aquabacterium terrae]NRF67663.1 phasin family protein [Aquabacterium terrae]